MAEKIYFCYSILTAEGAKEALKRECGNAYMRKCGEAGMRI